MAKRKVTHEPQAARPTLEEIKVQHGKYVIASYRGYESGAISISIPDSYQMNLPVGYQPQELLIEPWTWRVIPEWWLDDGRFYAIYQKLSGLWVKRTDTIPVAEDLQALPSWLENQDKFTRERKQKAWWIATQPYMPKANMGDSHEAYKRATYDLIHMKDMETTETSPQQVDFLQNELKPILQAARIYEERLGNRSELIRDIDARIAEIDGTPSRGTPRRIRPPIYT